MSSNLSGIVYINGKFCEAKDATVSAFDRGFIFGDGVYEVVPVVNHRLVDRQDFWDRFKSSLAKIELRLPIDEEKYEKLLYEIIDKNDIKEGGIYTQVTRGVAPRSFDLLKDLQETCFIFGFKKEIFNSLEAKNGIEVVTTQDLRWKRRDIKSISLLAQCLAKNEAVKAGVYEAVMVEDGFITECSSSSIFIIKNNVLITRPLTNDILPGIRRKVILSFAKELGLEVELRKFTVDELYNADEAFISAATLITLPIIKVDGKSINGAKVGQYSTKIRDFYANMLRKEAGLL